MTGTDRADGEAANEQELRDAVERLGASLRGTLWRCLGGWLPGRDMRSPSLTLVGHGGRTEQQ